MEKYKCKLCSKVFNNGRALGGHMKSHLAKLPICHREEQESESSNESLRRNPRGWRSKRVKTPSQDESVTKLEPVSSVSDTSPEEDVALCLMMLSRDTWHWVDSAELGKHKCEICEKVFKSTQALGGHRTSHKKARRDNVAESTQLVTRVEDKKFDKKKIHKCLICGKVFGSGQALGGHKRSHFLNSLVTNASSSGNFGENLEDNKSSKLEDNWIDLNMPAPMDDDDDDEEEISAVSEAEIINYG